MFDPLQLTINFANLCKSKYTVANPLTWNQIPIGLEPRLVSDLALVAMQLGTTLCL